MDNKQGFILITFKTNRALLKNILETCFDSLKINASAIFFFIHKMQQQMNT